MYKEIIKYINYFIRRNNADKVIIVLLLLSISIGYYAYIQFGVYENKLIKKDASIVGKDSIILLQNEICNKLIEACNTRNDSLYERIISENKANYKELIQIQIALKQGKWKLK